MKFEKMRINLRVWRDRGDRRNKILKDQKRGPYSESLVCYSMQRSILPFSIVTVVETKERQGAGSPFKGKLREQG